MFFKKCTERQKACCTRSVLQSDAWKDVWFRRYSGPAIGSTIAFSHLKHQRQARTSLAKNWRLMRRTGHWTTIASGSARYLKILRTSLRSLVASDRKFFCHSPNLSTLRGSHLSARHCALTAGFCALLHRCNLGTLFAFSCARFTNIRASSANASCLVQPTRDALHAKHAGVGAQLTHFDAVCHACILLIETLVCTLNTGSHAFAQCVQHVTVLLCLVCHALFLSRLVRSPVAYYPSAQNVLITTLNNYQTLCGVEKVQHVAHHISSSGCTKV